MEQPVLFKLSSFWLGFSLGPFTQPVCLLQVAEVGAVTTTYHSPGMKGTEGTVEIPGLGTSSGQKEGRVHEKTIQVFCDMYFVIYEDENDSVFRNQHKLC